MCFLILVRNALMLFFEGVMKNFAFLPDRYLRTVCRKQVKPLLDMRDDGFLRREL
jgi:hypothetical protein